MDVELPELIENKFGDTIFFQVFSLPASGKRNFRTMTQWEFSIVRFRLNLLRTTDLKEMEDRPYSSLYIDAFFKMDLLSVK
jgi:hypothetical protein